MLTPWGYEVENLTSLVSVEEMRTLQPNLSSTDATLQAVLDGVSAAVRSYCEWHISPALTCTFTGNGEGNLLMLPSLHVSQVNSLVIDGVEVNPDDYWWTSAGMLCLKYGKFPYGWRNVVCEYVAGSNFAEVQQVVAQIASNALVASPGVREEHAGNVGITYNQTGSGISGGVSILPRDYDILAKYKLARAM